ncbi:MAG TPA: hypothetical protein DDZ68_02690 [Parvularcula sp.]|nr:hypothetical protein [Parvularcula sp.]HBS30535.1 hypothetical protein [Parvularcula sp.]
MAKKGAGAMRAGLRRGNVGITARAMQAALARRISAKACAPFSRGDLIRRDLLGDEVVRADLM